MMKLILDSEGEECKYIVRWMQLNLKIGMAEGSILLCLARAFFLTTADASIIDCLAENIYSLEEIPIKVILLLNKNKSTQ